MTVIYIVGFKSQQINGEDLPPACRARRPPKEKRRLMIRVRFAPSPTGYLHVGSFRTALFNYLFARKNKGSFVLRIEDTDQLRSSREFLESQLADMRWMGLDWDEGPGAGGNYGPYSQMERLELYRAHAKRLLDGGKAYHCYCTPDELKERRGGGGSGYDGRCKGLAPGEAAILEKEGRKPCLRFAVPQQGEVTVRDLIKGDVSFQNNLLDDFVIMKSDGIPTYNFAVVVDDHSMEITHVIRGDEHMSNTPRQALLFDAFGYQRPAFCHIPIILNEDRTKLSKRKGAVHLLEFRDRGYLREALLNFLALLGWAPKDDREILSLGEMVEAFSLEGITAHPAVFDENKLMWMNCQYLNRLSNDNLAARLGEYMAGNGIQAAGRDGEWLARAVGVYRERMKSLGDFVENLQCYFTDSVEYDPAAVKKGFKGEEIPGALMEMARRIESMEHFREDALEEMLRGYGEESGISAGRLIQAVRLAATGRGATPPIFDVMVLTGKDLLVKRLRSGAEFIEKSPAPAQTA